MKINKKLILFIIIILVHFIFINGEEKLLLSLIFNKNKYILRPNKENNIFSTNDNYGMPSGHMEFITFIALYCYYILKLPIIFCITIVLLMGLQRYISNRHTILQIFGGILFSLIYFKIYNSNNFSFLSIFICISILLLYLIIIERIISIKLQEKIPDWVNIVMYKKIDEKKNTKLYKKYLSILLGSICFYINKMKLYISWSDLENMLDLSIKKIKNKNIQFNSIVGIKSGGAIISDYISKKLNINNYKIKLSSIENQCKSGVTIKDIINKVKDKNYLKNHIICENIKDNIENTNVILIDELCSTGSTMYSSIKYLKYNKNVNYVYPFTLTKFNNDLKKLNDIDILINKNMMILCWPWGWDN